jgi:hypothetical protein
MTHGPVPLSDEIEQLLMGQFRSEDRAEVRRMLLEYGTENRQGGVDRVRYDILHMADGDVARVRAGVDLAKCAPRDIMAAEYYRENGRSVPHEWAMWHPVNQKSR